MKLGDPSQLLRIVGSAVKIIPDAESYYYHENQDNLWVKQLNYFQIK